MIIKSSFKDYYDYIEHINGGDPKVVYVRRRMQPLRDMGDIHIPEHMQLDFLLLKPLPYNYSRSYSDCVFAWCIVAGLYYLLFQKRPLNQPYSPWTVVTPNSEMMHKLYPKKPDTWFLNNNEPKYYFGTGDTSSIELCRKLNQPVFVCTNGWDYIVDNRRKKRVPIINIECEIPILKDLGFASIIPAEQMYQNIAYFMSNMIKSSPDSAPPVEIGNKDKIVGHGFDLIESFRHRKIK